MEPCNMFGMEGSTLQRRGAADRGRSSKHDYFRRLLGRIPGADELQTIGPGNPSSIPRHVVGLGLGDTPFSDIP